jgi:sensor domain CHASE-containing protein
MAEGGNSTSALAKLLNSLNLPTLALILLTGGGNWFATEQNAQINRHEIQKAIDEVHRIFENQQRRESAYAQIEETNRIVKELKFKTGQ